MKLCSLLETAELFVRINEILSIGDLEGADLLREELSKRRLNHNNWGPDLLGGEFFRSRLQHKDWTEELVDAEKLLTEELRLIFHHGSQRIIDAY